MSKSYVKHILSLRSSTKIIWCPFIDCSFVLIGNYMVSIDICNSLVWLWICLGLFTVCPGHIPFAKSSWLWSPITNTTWGIGLSKHSMRMRVTWIPTECRIKMWISRQVGHVILLEISHGSMSHRSVVKHTKFEEVVKSMVWTFNTSAFSMMESTISA